jgi:nicotinamidase-related amidase
MNIQLLIIDPQNDFCWPGLQVEDSVRDKMIAAGCDPAIFNPGALFVPGADKDMERLAAMVHRLKNKIDDIHVTLDSHHYIDIAHPVFWTNSKGQHPGDYDFTIITREDVENGVWRTTNPAFQNRHTMKAAGLDRDGALEYVTALETNGRYPLCIWPPHCLISTYGYGTIPVLEKVLHEWEKDFAMVDFVTKGSNFWTEHYSAVQADVPDPEDPGTQLNMGLIETLQEADIALLSGEAKSHCLANTVIDIANNFGEENIKKMVLLEDCTSNVPDPPGTTMFTDISNKFVSDMVARGMQISNSVDFLK